MLICWKGSAGGINIHIEKAQHNMNVSICNYIECISKTTSQHI